MEDRIQITIENGVADVRLARPKKMNALDARMFDAIIATGEQLRNDPAVRAVVLSGEGKAFCAGLDMGSFAAMADQRDKKDDGAGSEDNVAVNRLATRTHGIANKPQYAAWLWRELPVPVIVALHGVALGGGFQVALGGDIRYAAPGTRMSVMEIKWGLVPDMAGTQLMRHIARDDVVRELTYTGRIFEAEEAQRLGFVTRVCEDPHAEAMATAQSIAQRSPDAIRAAKQLLNECLYLDRAEGLVLESDLQDSIIGKPNQIETVMAELEGRGAVYS